jgi:pilus assembly protein CpaD
MAAEVGPCGLWPADVGLTSEAYLANKPSWNHGCASQRNLAAMVANPADLVQPRGDGPTYPMRRTWVFEQYRKGVQNWSVDLPGAGGAK